MKEAFVEASRSPEVRQEVERRRNYEADGERLSEELRKPRIYQQHREPSARYYPSRKEVDAATRDKFDRSWKKIRRQDEERARRSRN